MKPKLLHLKRVALMLLLIMSISTASAYSFKSNGIYYNITSSTNMTVCVTYSSKTNNDYSGIVDIPNSVTYDGKNYTVTAIGEYAFTGCTSLTKVQITSKYLTTIGSYAFSGCNGLSTFVFPKQVTSVGNYAFSGCFGISEISFPFAATQIWLGYGCSKGEQKGLFEDCLLEKVTIDRELNYYINSKYGYSPFANQGFLEEIEFGEDVEYIPGNVFYGNTAITSYTVPSHITQLANYAFNGFTTAKHIIINEGTTAISNYAFSGCKNLKSFDIPSTVTTIGEGAFAGSGLTSIVIHPGIKSIGNSAFNSCNSLSQLTIEESDNALSLGCATDSESSSYLGRGLFYYSPLQSVFIGRPLSYNTAKRYGYSPFAYNETLKTARLGNPVTTIQPYLFANCTAFTTLNYNSNCNPKSVGDYAFWGCTSLTE
ncbi:MAG: leucine-rich repeat domain-containing protein, partial [Muribaculaceae bacterium]|nr:leucine-rich repeat domain-containing protein [Muribaculaceae bacterium]